MIGTPFVGHEDYAFAVRQSVGALTEESFLHGASVVTFAARVVEISFPWAHDRACPVEPCGVGRPAGASAGNHPVVSSVTEEDRRLVLPARGDAHVPAGVGGVVVGQFGYLNGEILLAGVDVIGFAVAVHKELHVTGHLPAVHVAAHVDAGLYSPSPLGCPPFQLHGVA